MRRTIPITAALLALQASAAVPAGAAPAADPAAEIDFVTRAAAADLMAVAESRLVLERASAPAVRDFARGLVAARGGDEAALQAAAEGSGAPVPTALDPAQRARLAALETLSGPEFDRAYLHDQAEIHSNALTLYGDYMLLGDDARLKALAVRMIPIAQAEYSGVQALAGR